jgi:Tol biopolymer transport system component
MFSGNTPFQLQIANADGSGARNLASLEPTPFVHGVSWSPDGKTILVSSIPLGGGKALNSIVRRIDVATGGTSNFYVSKDEVGRPVWMADGESVLATIQSPEGGSHHQLWSLSFPSAEIQLVFPNCYRDGKWIVFSNHDGTQFFRMEVEGGTPQPINVPLSNGAPVLRISPDGQWLAYLYSSANEAAEQIAIIPSTGGKPAHMFPLAEDTNSFMWAPDGRGVQFVLQRNGASNIWEQPRDGGPRRQITNFTSRLIFDFAWSRDGKDLLLAKGENDSDVILMTNFR